MRYRIGDATLELVQGDIVPQDVDAVVNAASESLAAGGGVSGAIHRAAGPQLEEECLRLGGCPPGEARLTAGYRLRARFVIHAVGQRYAGRPRDAEVLAGAYRGALGLASGRGLRSVAFPSIGTGIFAYPLDEAAAVALRVVAEHLRASPGLALVRFVLWDEKALSAYTYAARKLGLAPEAEHRQAG